MVRRLVWAAAAVLLFVVGLFVGRITSPAARNNLDVSTVDGREESRISDPTGRFDAVVLAESYGGAVGGVNWYVCIVPRGQPATSAQEAVMMSTSTRNEKVFWRESRLLEIRYDRAEIMAFTNLWSTNVLKTKWFSTEEPYWIEVRLVPSSPAFSILTPDGGFQTGDQEYGRLTPVW